MARAYGSSAHLLMKRETAYGQAATGNYLRMPFLLLLLIMFRHGTASA
jgi:hypothetical protein